MDIEHRKEGELLQNIFGLSQMELEKLLSPWQVPKYRAGQIAEWLYKRGAADFASMNNLPQNLRERLSAEYTIGRPQVREIVASQDGQTSKFLLELTDGAVIETVLMRHHYGMSICISSQVGCPMRCAFCASTMRGFVRNLTAGEMVAQAVVINDILRAEGQKVDTVVIMGSGEPLINYDNVLSFIRLLHEDYVLGLGYRNFTISTSGIVPAVYRLADEGVPISLSLSLHAPNDRLRSKLMPVNRQYPLSEIIPAMQYYAVKTKRRVTYEYILIADINDSMEHAEALIELLLNNGKSTAEREEILKLTNVNLIPLNPVVGRPWQRPSEKQVTKFEQRLRQRLSVTVRREMGTDIAAACGQLRNRYLEKH